MNHTTSTDRVIIEGVMSDTGVKFWLPLVVTTYGPETTEEAIIRTLSPTYFHSFEDLCALYKWREANWTYQ